MPHFQQERQGSPIILDMKQPLLVLEAAGAVTPSASASYKSGRLETIAAHVQTVPEASEPFSVRVVPGTGYSVDVGAVRQGSLCAVELNPPVDDRQPRLLSIHYSGRVRVNSVAFIPFFYFAEKLQADAGNSRFLNILYRKYFRYQVQNVGSGHNVYVFDGNFQTLYDPTMANLDKNYIGIACESGDSAFDVTDIHCSIAGWRYDNLQMFYDPAG